MTPPLTGPIAITGRVGTMKRKRQIRDALEQIDRDYTDDIFESTPFKKKVKRVQVGHTSSVGLTSVKVILLVHSCRS